MVVVWLMYIGGRPSYGILKASWSCNCVMYSIHMAWNFYISLNSRSRSNSKLKEFISPLRWTTHLLYGVEHPRSYANSTLPFQAWFLLLQLNLLLECTPCFMMQIWSLSSSSNHMECNSCIPICTSFILHPCIHHLFYRITMHFFPSLLPVCYDVPFFRDLHPLYKLSLRNCVAFLLRHILAPTHFSMARALVNCCRISYINSPW